MKTLLVITLLSLIGCTGYNQAHIVHSINGGRSVDAKCGTHVNECYKLIKNTCGSSYRVLFVNYTELVEYNISASCDML